MNELSPVKQSWEYIAGAQVYLANTMTDENSQCVPDMPDRVEAWHLWLSVSPAGWNSADTIWNVGKAGRYANTALDSVTVRRVRCRCGWLSSLRLPG